MTTHRNASVESLQTSDNVSELEVVLYHGALAILITFGIVGNIMVLTVVKRTRAMHTTTNFLLANLACSDLTILFWRTPFFFIYSLSWPAVEVSVFICKFVYNITAITATVCVLTLTLICIERYHALLKPMEIRRRLTKRSSVYAICAVWVFSIALILPIFSHSTYVPEKQRCSLEWDSGNLKTNIIILGLVLIVAPFSVMCFCYFRIIYGMYCAKNVCKGPGFGCEEEERARQKIVRGLLTVTFMFALCFIPFGVCSVLYQQEIVSLRAYALVSLLFYCSSCLNPINYAYQSSNYRQALKYMLHPSGEGTETVV